MCPSTNDETGSFMIRGQSWHHHSSMGTASGSVLSFYVLQKNIKSATGPFSEHNSENQYNSKDALYVSGITHPY
jgi:hypothetical protein